MSTATSPVSVARGLAPSWRGAVARFDVWIILAILFIVASVAVPDFLTASNLTNLLRQSAVMGVLSISQFLVVLVGGFDLSVSSTLALSSVLTATVGQENLLIGIAVAVSAGLFIGGLNGLVVTRGKVPPLIATLGMAGVARAAAFAISERSVTLSHPVLREIGMGSVGPLPYAAVIWLALAIMSYAYLRFASGGAHLYAVGGNEHVAALAGINVKRVQLAVYTAAGGFAAVAGVLFVGRTSSGMPHVGVGWELDTIAAVIIGGAQLFGGKGTLPKAMAGVVVYMMISNTLNLFGLSAFYQEIMKGIIIFLAVWSRVGNLREW